MTTHYQSSSRGPVEIAKMAHPHLLNALDKLVASRSGNERQDEVDAMRARLAEIEAEADDVQ